MHFAFLVNLGRWICRMQPPLSHCPGYPCAMPYAVRCFVIVVFMSEAARNEVVGKAFYSSAFRNAIPQEADVDGNGTIDYEEFLAATVNRSKLAREELLKEVRGGGDTGMLRTRAPCDRSTVAHRHFTRTACGQVFSNVRCAQGRRALTERRIWM